MSNILDKLRKIEPPSVPSTVDSAQPSPVMPAPRPSPLVYMLGVAILSVAGAGFKNRQKKMAAQSAAAALRNRHQESMAELNAKALALVKENQLGKALVAFEALHRLSPKDASVLVNLALTQKKLKKNSESEASLLEALKLDPQDAVANNNLGILWLDRGDMKMAREFFDKALESSPSYADSCLNLGFALEKLGEYGAAIKIYERYLKLPSAEKSMSPVLSERLRRLLALSKGRNGGDT